MQWNPFQLGALDSGLAGGSLLISALLEKTGVCGRGTVHDAHQEWDSHRVAYFACQLRQSGLPDRKSAPSRGSRFLPDRFSLVIASFLDPEERRGTRASGHHTEGIVHFSSNRSLLENLLRSNYSLVFDSSSWSSPYL